jgi:ATP dependent DNA ligase C terminal region
LIAVDLLDCRIMIADEFTQCFLCTQQPCASFYSGLVGTGLSNKTRLVILRELQATQRKTCPFSTVPHLRDHFGELRTDLLPNWVRPTLVVEVEYRQRLKDGLRYVALKGLRPEKKPGPICRSPVNDRDVPLTGCDCDGLDSFTAIVFPGHLLLTASRLFPIWRMKNFLPCLRLAMAPPASTSNTLVSSLVYLPVEFHKARLGVSNDRRLPCTLWYDKDLAFHVCAL